MKYICSLAMIFLLWCSPPAISATFSDNGDGTVSDADTNLMWQQGEGGRDSWFEGEKYCDRLTLAGHSDWRLPTMEEMQSIVDTSKEDPVIDTSYFPDAYSQGYWVSNSYEHDDGGIIYFLTGFVDHGDKYHEYYVRCVRPVK